MAESRKAQQIASWAKQADMVAFSAVSYRSKAGEKPALGTIQLESKTKVSLEDRLVSFTPMKIVEASFQTLQKEQIREIVAEVDKAIPDDDRVGVVGNQRRVSGDRAVADPAEVERTSVGGDVDG